MREVIDKIVKIEADADNIIRTARDESIKILSNADGEISLRLQEVKDSERYRIAVAKRQFDAEEKLRVEAALASSIESHSLGDDQAKLEKIAQSVADRIKKTVFDV